MTPAHAGTYLQLDQSWCGREPEVLSLNPCIPLGTTSMYCCVGCYNLCHRVSISSKCLVGRSSTNERFNLKYYCDGVDRQIEIGLAVYLSHEEMLVPPRRFQHSRLHRLGAPLSPLGSYGKRSVSRSGYYQSHTLDLPITCQVMKQSRICQEKDMIQISPPPWSLTAIIYFLYEKCDIFKIPQQNTLKSWSFAEQSSKLFLLKFSRRQMDFRGLVNLRQAATPLLSLCWFAGKVPGFS